MDPLDLWGITIPEGLMAPGLRKPALGLGSCPTLQ